MQENHSSDIKETKAILIREEYRRRFGQNPDYRQQVWKILVDNFFQNLVGQDKVVLDLGTGWGEFINHVKAQEKWAMDMNPDSASKLAEEVKCVEQDCSKAWQVPTDQLDVVFTSNFLEHLPSKDHLRLCLLETYRCLKPGGKIICLGPNIRYTGGQYWDFLDHHLPLTELSLVEMLEIIGFKKSLSLARFLPYTMARKKNPPLGLVKLYLKIPLAWTILGKQFLVVATKR